MGSILRFISCIFRWLDFCLATVLLYTLSFLPKFLTRSWYPCLFRWWCWVFIRAIGVDLRLHQRNQRDLPKQYILIGNHPSAFEDIGMPALFKVRFLAKIEVKSWWILGRISDHARTLYVQREDKQSRKEAGNALMEALQQGDSIGLYPEGGCKGRRIHLPFQYGAFDIALKTNTPIVPVFLHYETQTDFEWAGETLVQKIITMSRSANKTVHYHLYDAIMPSAFSNKEELTEHVQNLYLQWQRQHLE